MRMFIKGLAFVLYEYSKNVNKTEQNKKTKKLKTKCI